MGSEIGRLGGAIGWSHSVEIENSRQNSAKETSSSPNILVCDACSISQSVG